MARGFSEEVARQVTRAICSSSSKVYEGKWNVYCKWCEGKEIDPVTADIHQVADFLLFLFAERKLSLSGIKGYRSALAKVLNYSTGTNISDSPVLSDLISAFEHQRPTCASPLPKWDLNLVLEALSKDPYEPLSQASLKMLTFKTVFLLTLAAGARCSEIHALDVKHITHLQEWSTVKLAPHPKFLAKNFDYSQGGRNFEGFIIKALDSPANSTSPRDVALCPVRALRAYLDKTAPLRGDTTQLFISLVRKSPGPVRKNTVASWLRQTVLLAYQDWKPGAANDLRVSSHEVRAIATSTAFFHNVAMKDLLRTARWRHQSTFTSFYLRDVAEELDGLKGLGPIMVAQNILHS